VARPATPFLQLDVARLRANIERVAIACAAAGIAVRPHAKTHKCLEIARLQLEAGAVGLTVATLGEAEVFVAGGVADVFVGYPVWIDDERAARLVSLARGARLSIGVDSFESARQAARLVPGTAVLVEVDSGQHRTGVEPAEAGPLAVAAAEAGLDVRGVFTFPGHGYSPDGRHQAARDEARALAAAVASCRAVGVEPAVVSGGSTPTLADAVAARVSTEQRPGVSCFNDAQQWELGTATPDQVALTCHTTVVSLAGGRIVLDAGSKTLGADRAAYASGYGRLLDHPDARIVQLSEHHAVVEGYDGRPALGSRVRVVPNHVCAAVNLADVLWADGVEVGVRLEPWAVAARGRNT
jgi:D-serine deaminase-like pyridoxal phosphate-dependent protein